MTETEQIEVIKKWWEKYNNIITILLSLILLSVAGFKYYHWHQDKITEQASMAYEHLMLAFSNQDNRGVRAYSNQLLSDYGNTVYADIARLTLAKIDTLREKLPKAEEELRYVALHSKMMSIQQVAKVRLARIYVAEKAYDKALAELASVNSVAYTPVVNELRGDIYAAIGQYDKAVLEYRRAVSEAKVNGIGNLFLEMKTNELAAMTQSMNIEDKESESA
jgi:predicted negative regulator of RcsB-dependent stress response